MNGQMNGFELRRRKKQPPIKLTAKFGGKFQKASINNVATEIFAVIFEQLTPAGKLINKFFFKFFYPFNHFHKKIYRTTV